MNAGHPFRRLGTQSGVTLIELMVSVLAASIVLVTVSRLAVSNQRMIAGGHSQAALQQEVARLVETVTRDVRRAHTVAVVGASGFNTYDDDGNVLHVFGRQTTGGLRLFVRDGITISDGDCTALIAAVNADSTVLDFNLSLADAVGNQSEGFIQVCVRNRALEF